MINRRTLARSLAGAFGAAALSLSILSVPVQAADKVSVFAAASLKNALDEVSAAWKAEVLFSQCGGEGDGDIAAH